MKKIIIIIFVFILSITSSFFFFYLINNRKTIQNSVTTVENIPIELPLAKYSFESLRTRQFLPGTLEFAQLLTDEDDYSSYKFFFTSEGKSVSGLSYIPKNKKSAPIIVMFRGFVDREIYETGIGTKRVAEAIASAGFITLAPDFLGYGDSASPSADPMEERFETYTTSRNLLATLPNLNQALSILPIDTQADYDKVGLWGHSNGGQIALATLAITGGKYPTVLWAPVSKPFPYSILYFTDEYEDNGKKLRKLVADFEKDYDIEKFSPTNYFDWINAPIQLHQGINDDAVPVKWSNQLYDELIKKNKTIQYYTYPSSNHHLIPAGWQTAVDRSIKFYKDYFVTLRSNN